MRRAARTDFNHAEIVEAFRACGCEVLSLAAMAGGCPDLLVFHPARQRLILVEVKDGDKSPSRRALQPLQELFRTRWPVTVVESVEGAVEALKRSDRPTRLETGAVMTRYELYSEIGEVNPYGAPYRNEP